MKYVTIFVNYVHNIMDRNNKYILIQNITTNIIYKIRKWLYVSANNLKKILKLWNK